jgi:hypothetical protein
VKIQPQWVVTAGKQTNKQTNKETNKQTNNSHLFTSVDALVSLYDSFDIQQMKPY